MLKIVATISDFGAAANIGGPVENKSVIIDIPTSNIPQKLKDYIDGDEKETKWLTLSFSLLEEET